MKNDRVFLRRWDMSDAYTLVLNLNDKEMSDNLGTPYPYSLDDAQKYIMDSIEKEKPKFAIIQKNDMSIVGGCGIHVANNSASASMWIAKDKQGLGLGTEAAIILVQYCFDTFNINQMDNIFFEGNVVSQRIQEKIGSIIEEGEDEVIVNGNIRKKRSGYITRDNFEKALNNIIRKNDK